MPSSLPDQRSGRSSIGPLVNRASQDGGGPCISAFLTGAALKGHIQGSWELRGPLGFAKDPRRPGLACLPQYLWPFMWLWVLCFLATNLRLWNEGRQAKPHFGGPGAPPSGPEVPLWMVVPSVVVVQGCWDRALDMPFPICVEVVFCGMQCLWG